MRGRWLPLLFCAAVLGQESSSIETHALPALPETFWDLDAGTVLSRARAGALVADVRLLGSPRRVQLVGGARWAPPDSAPAGAERPWLAFDTLFVLTDQGSLARVVLPGNDHQTATVAVQRDGTPRFPAPVRELQLRVRPQGSSLHWADDAPAQVFVQRGASWQLLGDGAGTFPLERLDPGRSYRFQVVRREPGVGAAVPAELHFLAGFPLQRGSLPVSRAETPLWVGPDTTGGPLCWLTDNQVRAGAGVELGVSGSGPWAFFQPPHPTTPSARAFRCWADDVLWLRDRKGRLGLLWFRPAGLQVVSWWLADTGSRKNGPAELVAELLEDRRAQLDWQPEDNAAAYRVYAVDIAGRCSLLAEVREPAFTCAAPAAPALAHFAVSWLDAAGRESWPSARTLAVLPPGGEYLELRFPTAEGHQGWDLGGSRSVPKASGSDLWVDARNIGGRRLLPASGENKLFPLRVCRELIDPRQQGPRQVSAAPLVWLQGADGRVARVRRLGRRGDTSWVSCLTLRLGLQQQLDLLAQDLFPPDPATAALAMEQVPLLDHPDPDVRDQAREKLQVLGPEVITLVKDLAGGSAQSDYELQRLLEAWLTVRPASIAKLALIDGVLYFPDNLPGTIPPSLHQAPLRHYAPGERARYSLLRSLPTGTETLELTLQSGEERRTVSIHCQLDGEPQPFDGLLRGVSQVDWLPAGRSGWLDLAAAFLVPGLDEREQLRNRATLKVVDLEVAGRSLSCLQVTLEGTRSGSRAQLRIWYSPELPALGIARLSSRLLDAEGQVWGTDLEFVE